MANEKYDLDTTVSTLARIAESLSDLSNRQKRLNENQKDIEGKIQDLNALVSKIESIQNKQNDIIDSIKKLNAATESLKEALQSALLVQSQIATNNINSVSGQVKANAKPRNAKKTNK